jgi:hypothetical protein
LTGRKEHRGPVPRKPEKQLTIPALHASGY